VIFALHGLLWVALVAGGDGTQALVAGIAAEHALPFLVISAGTRNHFALDLGLDRENPAACLDALRSGPHPPAPNPRKYVPDPPPAKSGR
jgi:Diacylglycerol kinase catalytic domain